MNRGKAEHRVRHLGLDVDEADEQQHSGGELGQHRRVRPSHRVAPVGLDPVGDADHDEGQPEPERQVAEPVDRRAAADAAVLELE